MRIKKFVFIMAWLAFLLVSCAAPRGPYSPISREDELTPHQMSHGVTMLDMEVRNSFLLVNHIARKTPVGQIAAKITLQNMYKNDDIWADVQFIFYDRDNMPIEKSVWRTVHFPPQELVLVTGNSMRSNVEKFNIQFKNLKTRDGRRLTPSGRVYEHGNWKEGVLPR